MGQAGSSQAYDGYMSEIWHYDGRQLEPTHFGYTESQSGIWRPKKIENPYSTPNNGTTWSNHLTVSSGSISNAANAFNKDVLSFNTSSGSGLPVKATILVSFGNFAGRHILIGHFGSKLCLKLLHQF